MSFICPTPPCSLWSDLGACEGSGGLENPSEKSQKEQVCVWGVPGRGASALWAHQAELIELIPTTEVWVEVTYGCGPSPEAGRDRQGSLEGLPRPAADRISAPEAHPDLELEGSPGAWALMAHGLGWQELQRQPPLLVL